MATDLTGHQVIEDALKKAAEDNWCASPAGYSPGEGRAFQRGLAAAYLHALEMIPAPAPAAEPVSWTPGPNVFKDWCSQWFGPDADDDYLAKAVFALPPVAQRFSEPAQPAPQAGAADGVVSIMRAMGKNYSGRHVWDKLDAAACCLAADEIERLRTTEQPDRAVMQQALDAIEQALNVLGTGTGSCTVCQCQGCAYERKEVVSILRAALSATMDQK